MSTLCARICAYMWNRDMYTHAHMLTEIREQLQVSTAGMTPTSFEIVFLLTWSSPTRLAWLCNKLPCCWDLKPFNLPRIFMWILETFLGSSCNWSKHLLTELSLPPCRSVILNIVSTQTAVALRSQTKDCLTVKTSSWVGKRDTPSKLSSKWSIFTAWLQPWGEHCCNVSENQEGDSGSRKRGHLPSCLYVLFFSCAKGPSSWLGYVWAMSLLWWRKAFIKGLIKIWWVWGSFHLMTTRMLNTNFINVSCM